MHDIRAIRADPAGFDAALARRGLSPVCDELMREDGTRRHTLTLLQEKQKADAGTVSAFVPFFKVQFGPSARWA